MNKKKEQQASPFNSYFEIGTRHLSLLTNAYPRYYSIQQLAVLDYIITHTDDLPGGPKGIHPQTPQRGGELVVRRSQLHNSLTLFMSRNFIKSHYRQDGIFYSATENSASFLDSLQAPYTISICKMAEWVVENYGETTEEALNQIMEKSIGEWCGESNLHSEILKEWDHE